MEICKLHLGKGREQELLPVGITTTTDENFDTIMKVTEFI